MRSKNKIRILAALALLLIFAGWTWLIYKIPPTDIVAFLGTENSYILIFALAFLGGTSILFPFPYYLVVFTLAAGDLNPIYLAVLAGTGVMLGDSTSYLVGYTGREILSKGFAEKFNRIYNWIIKKPRWLMPVLLYFYSFLIPFPNDFVVIPLGLARYPYVKAIIPLWLGNISFNLAVAFAGFYGVHLLGL